ncbi:L-serine ammonia-lyase [Dietzia sp.]|uniref:L-serine ammonia-lyase n=1 Tax=Dietzia sp. TaxID=1871616 RepID=UPI002FD9F9E8
MRASVVEMFSIGIGPSSSHTVGPMIGAALFARELADQHPGAVARVEVDLFGSLAATGRGHGTPGAVLAGLEGADPTTVDVEHVRALGAGECDTLTLSGGTVLDMDDVSVSLRMDRIATRHPNTVDTRAFDVAGEVLLSRRFFSVGGGFVEFDGDSTFVDSGSRGESLPPGFVVYSCADDLLRACTSRGMSISRLVSANEAVLAGEGLAEKHLLEVWRAMRACIEAGFSAAGTLPGGLGVERRAATLAAQLGSTDSVTRTMDTLNAAAIAVNEENAAGHRVVTAPTNGAAGIVPAVMYWAFECGWDKLDAPGSGERTEAAEDELAVRFLLAAGGIGALIKERASISGAELGCQGEVGSACAMAAAGLAEIMGGTPAQVENAAEIGIEHNLGLTCDPVGALVQIPCIERNAVGAVKAVNAALLSLKGSGEHRVSLDTAVESMRQTGLDMMDKYKETSLGGLAVNVPEC